MIDDGYHLVLIFFKGSGFLSLRWFICDCWVDDMMAWASDGLSVCSSGMSIGGVLGRTCVVCIIEVKQMLDTWLFLFNPRALILMVSIIL